MYTDTLFYNTNVEKMWFEGPTTIVNKENVLKGEHGYYLVDDDIAFFDKKPVMHNETQRMKADSIYYNRNIGLAKAYDRVDMIDTSYKGYYFFRCKDASPLKINPLNKRL